MVSENIWNAVIDMLNECDFPTDSGLLNGAQTVFQYYSELESGGHESLFSSLSTYIEENGIETYLKEITEILEQIGAHDYAVIGHDYCAEIWQLYVALENDEIEESEFYTIIEKADDAYNQLDDKLEQLLTTYFVKIHGELAGVIEDLK